MVWVRMGVMIKRTGVELSLGGRGTVGVGVEVG